MITTGLALLAYVAGLVLQLLGGQPVWLPLLGSAPAILLGLLVAWRRRRSPVGPALVWLVAAPALTWAVELWGPALVAGGVWVFNLAGFVWLCLVFPAGLLPGRRWRAVPWCFLAAATFVIVVSGLEPASRAAFHVVDAAAGLALLGVLGSAVAALVVRYRRGDDLIRTQLRWLMLGATSVPVLLAAGWVAEFAGASVEVAYGGFLGAMALIVPAAVAIAILRHDLLDVDRLLSATVSWLITSIVSAGVFALVVVAAAQFTARAAGERIGITAAAFVTALALLPVHRRVYDAVGRLLDRERTVMVAAMRQFVRRVRDGQAQPEDVEAALRGSLGDPGLRVLLRLPGADGYVDLAGSPVAAPPDRLPLTARDSEVGALVLGRATARRSRQARELAVEARLPIEVSRLRIELRRSRARLVEAVTDERRRLERDLHDGAQQRILAVGMRLRSIQRTLAPDGPIQAELDAAVGALEATVAELRRIAHGIRPSRLDEGLDAAVRDLVRDCPLPVEVRIDATTVAEPALITAYYVIAEALANTLKHATATRIAVTVTQPADRLLVRVHDDGRGGAVPGSGLTALNDRVAAVGGRLAIDSPPGAGTTVRAEV
ncbi:histidine kinase [Dactylosporangium sp. NPDC051541]|uniref:sensor histidine kinase n=1 Tax=Dactylosporangium sp. NPDC051541 TaxID=3363977 RepID=UPI0037A4008E